VRYNDPHQTVPFADLSFVLVLVKGLGSYQSKVPVNDQHSSYVSTRVLKLQVGFLLSETFGTSRDFELDVPGLLLDDDILLEFLRGTLHLSRNSGGILLQGELIAQFAGDCTRCLDAVKVNVTLPFEELFVYPATAEAEYSIPESGLLDIAPLVREEVIVQTPINILCRPDCKGMCKQCGSNLNDGPCACDNDDIDPRFAALRDLQARLKGGS
jgi:uncharacterized protein